MIFKGSDLSQQYNEDRFSPRDGELAKAADSLAAFIEDYEAIRNGCYSNEFHEAKLSFKEKYGRANISGINIGEIYADFE